MREGGVRVTPTFLAWVTAEDAVQPRGNRRAGGGKEGTWAESPALHRARVRHYSIPDDHITGQECMLKEARVSEAGYLPSCSQG